MLVVRSHSTASSSAMWRARRPPVNFVSGHSSTMCAIVWTSPQRQKGLYWPSLYVLYICRCKWTETVKIKDALRNVTPPPPVSSIRAITMLKIEKNPSHKHFVHSPAYGYPLSLANTESTHQCNITNTSVQRLLALSFGRKWSHKHNCHRWEHSLMTWKNLRVLKLWPSVGRNMRHKV